MSRSPYINAFIRDLFSHELVKSVVIDDGGDRITCATIKEAHDVIDSVDESEVMAYGDDGKRLGWFHLIMNNDDDEQMCDYTANEFSETLVSNIDTNARYQEIIDAEETEDYNQIDKARDLLKALLEDGKQLIGDNAGVIIQKAIDFIE